MTQHREPNLVSASSLGCLMMKCFAPPLKISYAERLSLAKVERRKRILLRFNFMFVVFTCLLQKIGDQRGIVLFFRDKFVSARWWYCFVRMWYSPQERWHLFGIPKWSDWWRKSNFFSVLVKMCFLFSLIKTSEGNLDPLKFPLKKHQMIFHSK